MKYSCDLLDALVRTSVARRLDSGEILVENKEKKVKTVTVAVTMLQEIMPLCIDFMGKIQAGLPPELGFYTVSGRKTSRIRFGRKTFCDAPHRKIVIKLILQPNSEAIIKTAKIKNAESKEAQIDKSFIGETLMISPGFPSNENHYLWAFVLPQVQAMNDNKINVDVASVGVHAQLRQYSYRGVKVNEVGYFDVRQLLQRRKYKRIIVHFWNEEVERVLEGVDISESSVFIFAHGADLLYRDYHDFAARYFNQSVEYSQEEEKARLESKDASLRKMAALPNVCFVFPSKWSKERCESLNNIKFANVEIIPSLIEKNIFKYVPKKPEQRKRVCIMRKYDDAATYGIDISVRAILELSHRECFKDIDFYIYGDGDSHELLLSPLRDFSNVHIEKRFLSHEEMARIYAENGIALFSTRMETFGVAAAEAALSGVVVISNNVAAVPEVFSETKKWLIEPEDYKGIANMVERLYKNPDEYMQLSQKMHEAIAEKYDADKILKEELKLLKTKLPTKEYHFKKPLKERVLTISVAAYNAEKFLEHGVQSILDSKVAHKVEILIVDDGSTDNTAKIAKKLEKMTTIDGESIVKYVKKENGGHGSTINKGIELATGKYFKLLDADDYYNTDDFEKFVDILEKEDSDLILTNYVEDRAGESVFVPQRLYDHLIPGWQYNLDDLCYAGYGFGYWGPLLHTSTFKTKMLKKINFKISEHCFYVDMEFNAMAFLNAETVTFYPLDIYIYFLGRDDQSVSRSSFIKNYKHHEKVTLRIIKDIYYGMEGSENKKRYVREKIIYHMLETQYIITTEFLNDGGKAFREFETKLKQYPEIYNDAESVRRRVKIARKTHGYFCPSINRLIRVKELVGRFRR